MVKEKSTVSFKSSLIVFLVLLVVSGVTLALSSGGFIVSVKEVGFSILSTGQKGVNAVISGVGNGVTAVKELAELKESYNKLVQQLEDYEYLQRNNAEIRKENEMLREQLGISKTIANKNYVAQIIGRDPDSLYSAITVNKGSRNGIKRICLLLLFRMVISVWLEKLYLLDLLQVKLCQSMTFSVIFLQEFNIQEILD